MFHVHPKKITYSAVVGRVFCNYLILLVDGVSSEMEYFVVMLVIVSFCFCFLFFW